MSDQARSIRAVLANLRWLQQHAVAEQQQPRPSTTPGPAEPPQASLRDTHESPLLESVSASSLLPPIAVGHRRTGSSGASRARAGSGSAAPGVSAMGSVTPSPPPPAPMSPSIGAKIARPRSVTSFQSFADSPPVSPRVTRLDLDAAVKEELKYNPEVEQAVKEWICAVLEEPTLFDNAPSFAAAMKSGIILCRLANKVRPGIVPKISTGPGAFLQMENITRFIGACMDLGMHKSEVFLSPDLYEAKNMTAVLTGLNNFAVHVKRRGYVETAIKDTSKLRSLFSQADTQFDAMSVDPSSEAIDDQAKELIQWANSHLANHASPDTLNNLGPDVRTGVKLLKLAEVVMRAEAPGLYDDDCNVVYKAMQNILLLFTFISQEAGGAPVECCTPQDVVLGNSTKVKALLAFLREKFDLDWAFMQYVNEGQEQQLSLEDLNELAGMQSAPVAATGPRDGDGDGDEDEDAAQEAPPAPVAVSPQPQVSVHVSPPTPRRVESAGALLDASINAGADESYESPDEDEDEGHGARSKSICKPECCNELPAAEEEAPLAKSGSEAELHPRSQAARQLAAEDAAAQAPPPRSQSQPSFERLDVDASQKRLSLVATPSQLSIEVEIVKKHRRKKHADDAAADADGAEAAKKKKKKKRAKDDQEGAADEERKRRHKHRHRLSVSVDDVARAEPPDAAKAGGSSSRVPSLKLAVADAAKGAALGPQQQRDNEREGEDDEEPEAPRGSDEARKERLMNTKAMLQVQERLLAAQLAMRKRVAAELLSSEETYLRNLTAVDEGLLRPLESAAAAAAASAGSPQQQQRGGKDRDRDKGAAAAALSKAEVASVFLNLHELAGMHARFIVGVRAKLAAWSDASTIAETLNESLDAFARAYAPYLQNYATAVVSLHYLLGSSRAFGAAVAAWEKQTASGLSLGAYLVLPVQRLQRYELLLRELAKYTPRTHRDAAPAAAALERVKRAIAEINATIDPQRDAALRRLVSIASTIDGLEGSQCQLVAPGRAVVLEGRLDRLERKGSRLGKAPYCFVLSDMFVLCDQRKNNPGRPFALLECVPFADVSTVLSAREPAHHVILSAIRGGAPLSLSMFPSGGPELCAKWEATIFNTVSAAKQASIASATAASAPAPEGSNLLQ
eukprot:m51a1_g4364 hypothetical protein (1137) ;mRNA; r:287386-291662